MEVNRFNWMIGGEAGYGIMNTGLAFAKFCIRCGLYVFLSHSYPSLIRGGHNTSSVRVSETEIGGHSKKISLLAALNKETIDLHSAELENKGIIIFDSSEIKEHGVARNDIQFVDVPFVKISMDISNKKLLSNSAALGASIALLEGDLKIINDILKEMYADKGREIIDWNLKAALAGYEHVKKNFKGVEAAKIEKIKSAKKYIVSGNEAIGMGAIAAGCKLLSQYPMTPTTQILSFMAAHAREYGIAVVQPEDEISSLHIAIGASHAGIRAMTATSGGGFSLMAEGLGLAGITEIPVVIVSGQRAGPSTGLPTGHEQADLKFAVNAGHGEFVKIVIAPANVEDAFYSTIEAFNLAERFQVPVILLVDKYLCVNSKSVEKLSAEKAKIDRGLMISDKELANINDFKRYNFDTINGVNYRSIPGQRNGLFNASSDEHDEHGQAVEAGETRRKIMEKRMKKTEFIKKELSKPELVGDKNAEITLVGWGSTKDIIREAMHELQESANLTFNHLHIKYMMPFQSEEIRDMLKGCKKVVVIEDNFSSQLSALIMEKTGIEIKGRILRYDGKQFSADELYKKILGLLGNRISGTIQNPSLGGAQWQA